MSAANVCERAFRHIAREVVTENRRQAGEDAVFDSAEVDGYV